MQENNNQNLWQNYLNYWKNSTDFNGVATRIEFWSAVLFNFLFLSAAIVFASLFLVTTIAINIIYYIYLLITFLPSLSCAIRRLHDIGKSGWFYLVNFIPLIGSFILIVMYCRPSTTPYKKQ